VPRNGKIMRSLWAFIRLSRLKFLAASFVGFALGAAIASYEGIGLTLPLYLGGQLLVTAYHLMTHYSNDYFDRVADLRTQRTAFSGGSGSLVDGTLSPRVALVAAIVCATIGAIAACIFFLNGNIAIAAIGVAIGLLSWTYSAPPLRLLSSGLGELAAALVVGVLVPLAGYAAFAASVDGLVLASTVCPALAVFAMMIAVQWPDIEADRSSGKRNLLVRYGKAAIGGFASACAAGAVAWLVLLALIALPKAATVFWLLLAAPAGAFSLAVRDPARPAPEIAARGVTLAFLALLCSLLAYLAIGRW